MKNLLIKLTLITAFVVACNTVSAVFSDSLSTYALWHCDATNWDGAAKTTPDDNSSGRIAHPLQINITNEAVMMPGSPYGGSYFHLDGTVQCTAFDTYENDKDNVSIDLSFRAHAFPDAGKYDVLISTPSTRIYLFGNVVRAIAYDDGANPHFITSSKTLSLETWYSVSLNTRNSNNQFELIVGNDTDGYTTTLAPSADNLFFVDGMTYVLLGWDEWVSGREANADLDEIRIETPGIIFTDIPKDMQVCPRLLSTNYANVKIAGEVYASGYDYIIAKVYRESVLQSVLTQALVYSAGKANFNLSPSIKAELANYDFIIALLNGSTEEVVATVNNVVAGDVFLVNGQSNAVAQKQVGSANGNQHQFLRSFGTHHEIPSSVTADLSWHLAEGDLAYAQGTVGQWALRMGRLLIEGTGIPIAIINNANGGKANTFFQRNDSNPEDIDTNYGRLFYRAKKAGVENNVRAILWHQGESDGGYAGYHEDGITNLYNAWLEDYPGFEKLYTHQIRTGCGVDQWNVDLRNSQRLLPDKFQKIEVMSTTGLNAHDGCHFRYDGGYELIGRYDAALLLRDLYGSSDITNIEPPNVDYIYFNDFAKTNITIVMRNKTDDLVWQSGAENYFKLENSSANITGGKASGNTIVLQLNGNVTGNNGLTYSGHSGSGPWVLNGKGVGLLTFYREPVANTPEPSLLLGGLFLGLAFLRRK